MITCLVKDGQYMKIKNLAYVLSFCYKVTVSKFILLSYLLPMVKTIFITATGSKVGCKVFYKM